MTRSISIFLLLVGLLWSVLVALYLVVVLGGISNPGHLVKMLLNLSWLYGGPLCLVGGAILSLRGSQQRLGGILALVGCLILTIMAGYQGVQTLYDTANPALIKPPLWEYAVVVILVLLADAGALRLYGLSPRAKSNGSHPLR